MARGKRILAATYHSYIDSSSGAAISLRDMMEALARRGWEVRVLSGPQLDFEKAISPESLLRQQGIRPRRYRASHRGESYSLLLFRGGGVDVAIWTPDRRDAEPNANVGAAWLGTFNELTEAWRPDVVVTYGGYWMTQPMLQTARRFGATTVFYLCNFAYTDRSLFDGVDVTVVLSQYQSDWYSERLGITTAVVPPLMPRDRCLTERRDGPGYVTFVNPQPHKGSFVFAKIVEELSRVRPDIRFLVVESRASADSLSATGAQWSATSVFRMPNTAHPRDYLKETKVLLVPSVWQESFGRVAAEALMNGIPVVGSTRGALPEVIGAAGILIDLPNWLTVQSRRLPEPAEVAEWIAAIEQLNDDPVFYQRYRGLGLRQARRWSEDSVSGRFEEVVSGAIERRSPTS